MGKTALIIGASGLVGGELLQQLLSDQHFEQVIAFVRNELPIQHNKLIQHEIDFDNLESYSKLIKGDVVFCCLGTTIKKAKTQEAFKKVDYEYPLSFANIAKKNGITKFIVISSLGASSKSSNFYLNVKGSLEKDLKKLKFESLVAVRPSMLLGNRKEFRRGELIAKFLVSITGFLMIGKLKRHKGIEAKTVAKAMMILSLKNTEKVEIVQSEKLEKLGQS